MESVQLWELIRAQGALSYGWWYSGAVLPAAILAGCVFLLTWYALTRQEEPLPVMLAWLAPSTLPFILVLPSYYASVALPGALDWIWEAPPQRAQDLSNETLRQIAGNLDTLAMLGLSGTTITLVLAIAIGLRLYRAPLERRILRAAPSEQVEDPSSFTAIIGPRPEDHVEEDLRVIEQKYGLLKIQRGIREKNHYSVFPDAVIGKKGKATIIIPDPIVSSEHASFIVHENQTRLKDLNSKNGTYIKRSGLQKPFRVTTNPVVLQHEDVIYLGHPSVNESVEIVFLLPQEQPAAT